MKGLIPSVSLSVSLAVSLAGCAFLAPGQKIASLQVPAGLEVATIGKATITQGTSRVLGSASLPNVAAGRKTQAISENPAAGAKVEILDTELKPTGMETTADLSGLFAFDRVPKGQTIIVRVSSQIEGQPATMRKVTRPTDPLQCMKVDIVSTMVTDKILSVTPLAKTDPGLVGVPLIELFRPERVDALEDTIRKDFTVDEAGKREMVQVLTNPEPAAGSLAEGGGTTSGAASGTGLLADKLFDKVVKATPELANVYHDVFERPDANLEFHIKATGINHNRQRKQTLSGVFQIKLAGVKAGTRAIEFWFSAPGAVKLGEANLGNDWTTTVDTWQFPDGPYTMDSILDGDNGRKKPIGKVNVDIDNSIHTQCGF